MTPNAPSYWNGNGELQASYKVLHGRIPMTGECEPHTPALEALRVAANAYYDFYNNGGGNRFVDIARITSMLPFDIGDILDDRDLEKVESYRPAPFEQVAEVLEAKITALIRLAGDEHVKLLAYS